jgi:CheY-like chemotaxis protein
MVFFDPPGAVDEAGLALVVSDDAAEREALVSYLTPHFRVRALGYREAGTLLSRRAPPEVVVIQWRAPAADALRRIRAATAPGKVHVVALADAPTRDSVLAMYQAGVDDFVRRPVVWGELLARVGLPGGSGVWRCASPRDGEDGARPALHRCQAFTNMGEIVAGELAEMIGPVEVVDGWLVDGETRAACISISIASENAEIRVSIVVDARLVHSLAEVLLGDAGASPDAVADMLREVVNTAGGAVKLAAGDENIPATTGLPVNLGRGRSRTEETRTWTMRVTGSGMQLGLIGEIVRHATVHRPLRDVRDGMVLSRDVLDGEGAVVVAAGTLLNMTTRARLDASLGPDGILEVMDPGAEP